jgi:hypothetical protein
MDTGQLSCLRADLQQEIGHTVIVKPPAAAVAGIDVVPVPVARVDDILDVSVYKGEGDGDAVTVMRLSQQATYKPRIPPSIRTARHALIDAPFWLERDRASGETWGDQVESASTTVIDARRLEAMVIHPRRMNMGFIHPMI